ncbi:hypothetical protein VTO42DRAFT_7524 [Malbranchea cinnamomea]
MKISAVLASTAMMAGSMVSAELDPIVTKGQKFFYKSNGTEFFMRGIAYQQEWTASDGSSPDDVRYKDPLADPEACKRDVPLLAELHTNTIRVYAINPEADHDECMKLLEEHGIYVVADLSEPATSINRDDPKWNDDLYERYTSVIDSMAHYTNVIGFFAGNEVTNNKTNTDASAYVKAAVRDMKKYIKRKGYREMGIGYATNDDAEIRDDLVDYFYCNSADESVDFWGYNIYSWCGDSSFTESGYDKVVRDFTDFSVPVFFAEYGCNEVQPRIFTEVREIYGDKMTPVLSGGIVYMYFQEENDYGLVEIKNGKAVKLEDFHNLKKQMEKINPKGTTFDEYEEKNVELRECPAVRDAWRSSKNLPPTPNKQLCSCMKKSLSCVAKDSLDLEDLGDLFGEVCGMDEKACIGISSNSTSGEYGAYSMCNPYEQLSFAFNAYYQNQDRHEDACNFNGAAELQDPTEPDDECVDLMEQAGEDGTGTVTTAPTGTTSPSSAASPAAIPAFNFGLLQLAAYVLFTITAGAGMIFM